MLPVANLALLPNRVGTTAYQTLDEESPRNGRHSPVFICHTPSPQSATNQPTPDVSCQIAPRQASRISIICGCSKPIWSDFMADETPSLHIDTDWKKQAQEEKRRLAEEEQKKAAQ